MLNQSVVFALIQQLGGSNNNIIYNVNFVDYCGGCHNSAMMLAQLLYWSDKTRIEGGWIAKPKEEWHSELRLSPYQMRKAEAKLKDELGILEVELRKFRGFPTNHYRLDAVAFTNSFVKFLNNGLSINLTKEDSEETSVSFVKKVEEPYTDTTLTDTTTKPTGKVAGGKKSPRVSVKDSSSESPTMEAAQTRGARKKSDIEVSPIFREAQLEWEKFYLGRIGTPYRFNGGKDGTALKALLTHLRNITPEKDWQKALELFNAILAGWDSLPAWYHTKLELSLFNTRINDIISNIRAKLASGPAEITGANF